ncbi:MAG: phosphatidylserine decarboxylase [Proteobacteria bacterium]|nr:phosphatidylserine decarboxylase [Pseudomonadota bacterium]
MVGFYESLLISTRSTLKVDWTVSRHFILTKPTTHNRYPDRTNFVLRVIAHQFWANLPREVQFLLSRLQSYCFKIKSSRFLIRPYCYFQYDSGFSRGAYASASGNPKYQSFQDFFSRRLALKTEAMTVPTWPCDGLIADAGPIDELSMVAVKGEPMSVRAIFGCAGEAIPDHYFFTNIFLHNRDYHRIHAPMSGS